MNTKSMLRLLPIALLFLGCRKEFDGVKVPNCIVSKFNRAKEDATVLYRVEAGENIYYYFGGQSCCDAFSDLYDERCRLICHPDGGITGQGDFQCPDAYINSDKVFTELLRK